MVCVATGAEYTAKLDVWQPAIIVAGRMKNTHKNPFFAMQPYERSNPPRAVSTWFVSTASCAACPSISFNVFNIVSG